MATRRTGLHWGFIGRAAALAAGLLSGLLLIAWLLLRHLTSGIPRAPLPVHASATTPQAAMPGVSAGLEAWASYADGQGYERVGSGFLLIGPRDEVVGVMAAHSLRLGDAANPLLRIAFARAGEATPLVEMEQFYGPPGKPRLFGPNLDQDCVLLRIREPIPPELVLSADPRGTPQDGERVALYSGVQPPFAEGKGFAGTVWVVDSHAIWVVMDQDFDPALMSGSPMISQQTGSVVGMAIAAGNRHGRLIIGINPIGALMDKAQAADSFPWIGEIEG